MKIFILGGEGQLGSALRARIPHAIAPTRAELDLADLDALRAVVREVSPDLVINCAAYNAVDQAESEPGAAMRINRDAVALLGEEARALITYSTDFVFDGALDRPYREDDEPRPLSAYGRSKLEGERALAAMNAPAIVFRTAWVWSLTHPSFVSTMRKVAREREALRVVADQIGNPTSAPDLADATMTVVRGGDLGDKRGVYHLAGATAVSRYELAKHVIERDPERRAHTIEPVPTSAFPTPAQRPLRVVFDCGRARETFGVEIPGYADAFARAASGHGR